MNTDSQNTTTTTTPATAGGTPPPFEASENEAPEYSGQATYSPEDNKLRLYIGRVPREEYLKLKAEGWTTLHKQRDAGGGDFAATWTPSRRDTALEYAGFIADEDMGPNERAADRAERFGGYRDRRTNEATGHADRYDAGPAAHGYQSQARAERAAARHDRIADRAGDAWGKAEYWQSRTAGVIRHALHKSSPGVRMGRIKTIEADLRKVQASLGEYAKLYADFQRLAAITDAEQQTKTVRAYLGARNIYAEYMHPRPETISNEYIKSQGGVSSLYTLITLTERGYGSSDITGAEACALFFSDSDAPRTDTDWTRHLELRLAYENQMLDAQGGRAAFVEMEAGGWIGKHQIRKVNKSTATGRVVSVTLKIPGNRYGSSTEGYHFSAVNIERLPADAYTPPSDADRASLKETKQAEKAATPKKAPCPLVNPTDADAERLQALWNDEARRIWNQYCAESYGTRKPEDFEASSVCRTTQANYSAVSGGTYAKAETCNVCQGGTEEPTSYNYNGQYGPAVCKVRKTWGKGAFTRQAYRVIVITDKPQKPFPAALWEAYTAPEEKPEAVTSYAGKSGGLSYTVNA